MHFLVRRNAWDITSAIQSENIHNRSESRMSLPLQWKLACKTWCGPNLFLILLRVLTPLVCTLQFMSCWGVT
jgi:hypothetical protein